ncbi:MAG: DUF1573 domain-containing protein [Prevotellaceae bacterium]|jgi:hypothetical protein|nr:DUF1573 domain-containing protein [Prevotellaceae bacterium]
MKGNSRIIILILSVVVLFACKENRKRTEAELTVKEWTGKTIQFPEDVQCNILGKDTVYNLCSALFQSEYKVLLYVDSAGCSSCRLKLMQWKQLIEESDSLFRDKLGFLFYFQPKNKKEMEFLFRRDDFDYPVFIDINKTINLRNHFPEKPEYQCFLLDKNNKVLMVGNPVLNPKIWELYKQTVFGETSADTMPVTRVSVEQSEMEISNLQASKKSVAVFKLKNTGNAPLLIARVDASCGCTVPVWEKKPVEPGDETGITLEITPEETGVFHKTVRVYCNVEKGVIPLIIKGTVK